MEKLISIECYKNREQSTEQFLKKDPRYFKFLINKMVEIQTIDGRTHVGRVYVVDPVSKSVVTLRAGDEISIINIYAGHAIKSLEIFDVKYGLAPQVTHNKPIDSLNTQLNEQNLIEKTLVKTWLNMNLVNVREEGMTLKVGDDLVIEPPYDNEHCYSSNTIILQRIRRILNNRPLKNISIL